MTLALGILAVLLVVGALGAVIFLASRQAKEEAPSSAPTDFVVPSSRGGFRWRQVDESPADFKARIASEEAEVARSERASGGPPPAS